MGQGPYNGISQRGREGRKMYSSTRLSFAENKELSGYQLGRCWWHHMLSETKSCHGANFCDTGAPEVVIKHPFVGRNTIDDHWSIAWDIHSNQGRETLTNTKNSLWLRSKTIFVHHWKMLRLIKTWRHLSYLHKQVTRIYIPTIRLFSKEFTQLHFSYNT